jgi:hypothetical protein
MARRLHLHRPDKAVAIAPPRLDQPLLLPTIADRLARLLDTALQRRITDELPGPHLCAEHVFPDQVRALFQEILQEVKHLGPQWDRPAGPVQGHERGVEDAVSEDIAHRSTPPGSARMAVSAAGAEGAVMVRSIAQEQVLANAKFCLTLSGRCDTIGPVFLSGLRLGINAEGRVSARRNRKPRDT